MVQKEIAVLREKARDLEREVNVKEVEVKVMTNKYNLLREDYTTLKLAAMVGDKNPPTSDKIDNNPALYDANSFGYIELIKEN